MVVLLLHKGNGMAYTFVYGTLKKGRGNHGVLGRSVYIGEAITNSQEFTMFDGGFPYVSDAFEGSQGSILGELYEVNDELTMENLDRLEGVPYHYIKREIEVTTLDNIEYKATIYLASPGSNERLKERTPMKPNGRRNILEWK
jgi:gamma-glutamylcyclotransferase (GGCT)/AIG2-like uncharacterized protein YtfP